ncbi:hypothetical protein O1W68_11835 [Rhodococcus sp. H36-A4]|uniref:hypothetical protein n=1 Tax=Rhodococcus sp. H36-A4 TaxID=3004353 RepID=UPI0022AF48C4|nr:hypothetical protein [Rhodococcus sp. H36-A4]MCZ4078635.1 hypothetical protein [Rhodococcus sp. H36-A4]
MYEHEVRVYVPDGDTQTFDYDTQNDEALSLVHEIEMKGYIVDKKNVYEATVEERKKISSDPVPVAIEYYFVKKS